MSSDKERFFLHESRDRGEIDYIFVQSNLDKFSKMKVKVEKKNPHMLYFSSKNDKNLEPAFQELSEITARYHRPITVRVFVDPGMIGFFRGKDSKHLSKILEKLGLDRKDVRFEDVEDKNGATMIEISVKAHRYSANCFMLEVLRSISALSQKDLKFEPPSWEERKEKFNKKKKSVKDDDDDEDDDDEDDD